MANPIDSVVSKLRSDATLAKIPSESVWDLSVAVNLYRADQNPDGRLLPSVFPYRHYLQKDPLWNEVWKSKRSPSRAEPDLKLCCVGRTCTKYAKALITPSSWAQISICFAIQMINAHRGVVASTSTTLVLPPSLRSRFVDLMFLPFILFFSSLVFATNLRSNAVTRTNSTKFVSTCDGDFHVNGRYVVYGIKSAKDTDGQPFQASLNLLEQIPTGYTLWTPMKISRTRWEICQWRGSKSSGYGDSMVPFPNSTITLAADLQARCDWGTHKRELVSAH